MVYNSLHKSRGLTLWEAFTRLTEIRSLMPSDRGIMALTATATRALSLQVEQMLEMRSPLAITHSPDKQNLRLSATKLKGFNNYSFNHILVHFR